MNTVSEEVQPWTKLRWTATIGFVVVVQLVLVLAFSKQAPIQQITRLNTQVILPEDMAGEFQALTDPTLFALGGTQSFSAVWLNPTPPPPYEVRWEQSPRWLSLDSNVLGRQFVAFAQSNNASPRVQTFKAMPPVLPTTAFVKPGPLQTESKLRVVGDLAGRKILNMPDLPPWPATDLLLPSKVRVLVDRRGFVESAILLHPGSGSQPADRFAVNQAEQIRFTPVPNSAQSHGLTLGQLVFEWHTTIPRAENKPGEALR